MDPRNGRCRLECAPSLIPNYSSALAGIDEFIEAGYVIAATDYQGLGTPGPHPYLVGESERIGALDSVRAAVNLDEAEAGADFVVWGESQGGQASLSPVSWRRAMPRS